MESFIFSTKPLVNLSIFSANVLFTGGWNVKSKPSDVLVLVALNYLQSQAVS